MPGRTDTALASMGIYIFNAAFLFEQLIKDADTKGSSRDFGKDIIPSVIEKYRVNAYPFLDLQSGQQSYWRDVGTIDAYWAANMELIGVKPDLNLYDKTWPIWTYQAQTPPAKFVFDDEERRGQAVDSMISGGCIVSGAKIRHSLLFQMYESIHSLQSKIPSSCRMSSLPAIAGLTKQLLSAVAKSLKAWSLAKTGKKMKNAFMSVPAVWCW